MVDLLEIPDEEEQPILAAAYKPEPHYPCGLCLYLDEETMEKLGLTEMPEVGEMIHIMAMAKVTSVGTSATESKDSKNISLQITHMALEDEDKEYSYSKTLYDNEEEEYEG